MMGPELWIIIIVVVVLKVIFWSCFCVYRGRQAEYVQRGAVVQIGPVPQSRGYNDQSAIVNHEVPPDTVHCPPAYLVAPPEYDMGVPKSQHMHPSHNYAV